MKFEKVGNIVTIHKGKKHELTEEKKSSSIRVLQIDDLRNDNLIKYTNDEKGVLANEEDLMIVWDGANAGTIGYGKTGFIGSTIAILRKKESKKYSTIYLGKFLQSQFHFLRTKTTGATIPHISRKSLEGLLVPEISISDQIQIATILSKAENLIAQRKESIALLEELLKSSFLEMFGDPVRNEKGWEIIKFKNTAKNENSKRVPVKQSDRDRREGIYPYYGATGIIDTIDDYKFDGEYLLIAEDGKNLLFRRKNNAFMARGKFWVNNHAHVLSDNKVCSLRYLEFFLNGIDFRPFISGIDQVKLNKENLDKIPVPFPPIKLQNQFGT